MPANEHSRLQIFGARVHNLKNVSVSLPLGKWTVITGVSGTGKSSLAFDTVHAESQRRYFETLTSSARAFLDQLERPDVDRIDHLPTSVAVNHKSRPNTGATSVAEYAGLMSQLAALALEAGTMHCPECDTAVIAHSSDSILQSLQELPEGTRYQLAFPIIFDHKNARWEENLQRHYSIWEAAGYHRFVDLGRMSTEEESHSESGNVPANWQAMVIADRLAAGKSDDSRISESLEQILATGQKYVCVLLEKGSDVPAVRWQISDEQQKQWDMVVFTEHAECLSCGLTLPEMSRELFQRTSPQGACLTCTGSGVVSPKKQSEQICDHCRGSGLNRAALNVRLPLCDDVEHTPRSVEQILFMDCESVGQKLQYSLQKSAASLTARTRSLLERFLLQLKPLLKLELGYLIGARKVRTLSTGEYGRLNLAKTAQSDLVNTLFLIDEPASGLHAKDCPAVIDMLRKLRDADNTVITVEHQPQLIAAADYVIDLGPEAGNAGGEVLYAGDYSQFLEQSNSVTAAWLSGREKREDVSLLASATDYLEMEEVCCYSLKNYSTRFPLQQMSVVTGRCGAGKSALICQTLFPHLQQLLQNEKSSKKSEQIFDPFAPFGTVKELRGWEELDQVILVHEETLGRSSRSTPITYVQGFEPIRKLFAETVDAKMQGFTPGRFSFNSARGGRCSHCEGLGTREIEMHFLANLTITCPECRGQRFNPETLSVKYRHRNIYDVLSMSVEEAFVFFRNHTPIQKKLQLLRDVGLGYLSLGQNTSTLSSGEAQRLKLASFLNAATGQQILYLFDEPSNGLHPADITVLVGCLRRLVEQGHTVIVIDHNEQIINAAEVVIDL